MGFKKIISFDHLALGVLSTNAIESYAGIGLVGNNYGIQPTVVQDIDGRKKLVNGGLYSAIQIRFNNIGLDTTSKIIMGYRHRPENSLVYGLYITAGTRSGGNSSVAWPCNIMGQTDEAYVEAVMDFANGKLSVYVDGVLGKTADVTRATLMDLYTSFGYLCFYGANSDYRSWITDIYFRDQVGSEVISPLGNVKLVPLALKDSAGAGWTPAAGQTLTETLNTIALAGTPVITNAGGAPVSPIVSNLDVLGADNQIVLAASFISSAMDSVAPAKTITGSVTIDGQNKIGDAALLTAVMQPGRRIGLFEKAPDGTDLTLGKLKAGSVTATFT